MDAIELTAPGAVVSVDPANGGRVAQITVDGRELLRSAEDGAAQGWGYWGCYPLLPWSNRIPGGTFTFEGREMRVPVNWSDGTALHGLTAWIEWEVDDASASSAALRVEVDEGPYRVRGTSLLSVGRGGLEWTLSVRNLAAHRVPVGLGIHPWFRAGRIRVPADLVWPGDGPLPDGLPRPVRPDEDLRTATVPDVMDRCYTGLRGRAVDVPGIRLAWDGPVTQVVVYTGEPGWVCVEPVTNANDAFRLAARGIEGTGTIALDPGASASVTYTFAWGPDSGASADAPANGAAPDA